MKALEYSIDVRGCKEERGQLGECSEIGLER